ncbi:MAG: amidohydrolase family protein [Planctomycetaceae bacterium]|jgi:imidazolonepropionase-like amidohydrolase|nr:amidohydrolase family protein [Planctomycetaceae bacterium]
MIRSFVIGLMTAFGAAVASAQAEQPAPGSVGGPGLALLCSKALVAAFNGEQVVDNAIVLVRDGKIEKVAPAAEVAVPVGYAVRDLGPLWCMPGMIDLHSHVGGAMDINEMVYVTNPELKVRASVIPDNTEFKRAIAASVTSVLYIPGSGTNSGGQGVLLKTGAKTYEEAVIRDPGSLKVAQWGNPERYLFGVGKTWENWHLRHMFTQGLAYAKRWEAFERGEGPQPKRDLRLELFRDLSAKRTQVSTHTQVAQVVMMTILMIKGEFGIDVYIDHGEFGGYLYAGVAQQMGVNAILGPRNVDVPSRGMIDWVSSNPEKIQGLAAGYAERGHKMIGFNTDAPVIPQEELFLQSAVNVKYGFDNSDMAAVRGHTIVPAITAGIQNRVGSLEPGKDADIVVISGDPSDPRSHVELVLVNGKVVYDPRVEPRRF